MTENFMEFLFHPTLVLKLFRKVTEEGSSNGETAMRTLTIALLSSILVACSTHTAHKKPVANDRLIRGSVITFEKRVSLKEKKTLIKKASAHAKATSGRSIASSCDLVKFCKLNAKNTQELYGEYSVLTTGKYNSNHVKSWTLVNGSGHELKLICGVVSEHKDKSCKDKLAKIQIKDMGPFIENLLEVRVAAAK